MTEKDNDVKKKRGRSPGYPAIDLEFAILKAKVLFRQVERSPSYTANILKYWGYANPTSGGGLATLSALIKYGLLSAQGSGENRVAQLTELGLDIVLNPIENSIEKKAAIKKAALNPRVFQHLWDKFNGSIPADLEIEYYLVREKNFTKDGARKLIRQFKKTLTFAGINKDNLSIAGEESVISESSSAFHADTLDNTESQTIVSSSNVPELSQRLREIQIPFSLNNWATLKASFPLTNEEWNQMITVLEAMKPALIEEDENDE